MKLIRKNEIIEDELYFSKLSQFLPAQRKNPFGKNSSRISVGRCKRLDFDSLRILDKQVLDFVRNLVF